MQGKAVIHYFVFTRPYILYEESIRFSLCLYLSVCLNKNKNTHTLTFRFSHSLNVSATINKIAKAVTTSISKHSSAKHIELIKDSLDDSPVNVPGSTKHIVDPQRPQESNSKTNTKGDATASKDFSAIKFDDKSDDNEDSDDENFTEAYDVIIKSLGRSGSSLTGDILSHGRGVYYVFEPLKNANAFMNADLELSEG